MEENDYLQLILHKYESRDLYTYSYQISRLKEIIVNWSSGYLIEIKNSGSRAKYTSISMASDLDLFISISHLCPFPLNEIYDSLYETLCCYYSSVRKQNVSVRVNINGLSVDVTPAKQQSSSSNFHSLYVSKSNTWKQTNIQKHIDDISSSNYIDDIKLLKIWRELHNLDFPSIYLEYLVIKELLVYDFSSGFHFLSILRKLADPSASNPLYKRLVDPANSNNVLSELLSIKEKQNIIKKAKDSMSKKYWKEILW